jgi:hypothetical protein
MREEVASRHSEIFYVRKSNKVSYLLLISNIARYMHILVLLSGGSLVPVPHFLVKSLFIITNDRATKIARQDDCCFSRQESALAVRVDR